jgi:hypothetical protein
MDAPLGRSDTVRLLEDALELIRQSRRRALVYHWLGSVPFSAALLFAWNSVTNARTTDGRWAGEALVLALGLVWMNCWRSVYAARLRCQLSGIPDQPWTAARVFQLVVIQSFFGATKLIVLPFSLLIVFPWAKTVAFYRILAVLAGREAAGPRHLLRRGQRLASFHPRQNWTALALLAGFQGMLAANLVVVLGIIPQIIRVLAGYESLYSRSGIYFLMNPVFALVVLAVCWIVFDPFVQAVYCVRSFEAESADTGEDLRCALRRIRAAAQAVAASLLIAAVAPLARAQIAPADLDRSVHQAMQAPEYDWRLPAAPVAATSPWLSRVLERVFASLRRAAEAIGDSLARVVRWIFEKLFPSGALSGKPGAPPGAGLDWTVAALIALVVAAGALLAWRRSRSRAIGTHSPPQPLEAVRLDSADLSADQLPEERWLELAENCLAEQNYRLALRALYLASLAWLGRRQFLSIHPGRTNHQYERELSRRARDLPAARALFAGNVASFERAWYGQHAVSIEDAARFRQNVEELKAELARLQGAQP